MDAPDHKRLERLLEEVARLRSRFERASRDGRDAFVATGSDSYDIGMLAVIHLADFVTRELPDEVAATLPEVARDGLRATRNIAAHNYAGLDNARLWRTVSEHAPALLDDIESALRSR
ncbi:HepT-like ribonuclease domain-containing protein [Agromyces bauzanensis]